MDSSVVFKVRCLFLFGLGAFVVHSSGTGCAQGLATIRSVTGRPFVTSVTPVIGPNGVVGGVSVDAQGVVARATEDELGELRNARFGAIKPQPKEMQQSTKMRMISLSNLDQALARLLDRQESPPEEMFFLAGIQRIEYVFVDPARRDVLLAGPAEGWRISERGDVVGVTSGKPVLRLDDLMEALRTSKAARTTGISCSIEPTDVGLKRYAQLLAAGNLRFNPATIRKIEQAMGTQQVIVSGVESDGHFARTMVAADYIMKRLALGFEPATIKGMPNYLAMLQRQSNQPQIASPRWWMAVNYQPLLHSPDGLAWQIRGQGLKTLTEDSLLDARGERTTSQQANPVAQKWADQMTENFDELMTTYPVFGQLRNCVDMAVVSALLAKRDLLVAANCQLDVLVDRGRLRGPQLEVPTSVESCASFVRGRRGWIVSVSGGVDLNSWSVVENVEESDSLESVYHAALVQTTDRWWW